MNGIIQDKQVFLETRVSMKGIGESASFSQPSLMPKKKYRQNIDLYHRFLLQKFSCGLLIFKIFLTISFNTQS